MAYWLKEISQLKPFKAFSLDLRNAALLVLDMQDFFLLKHSHAFIPSAETVVSPINNLVNLFKERNGTIIFTRHSKSPNHQDLMKRIWKDSIKKNSELYSINSHINITDSYVLNKTAYSAFYKTELDHYLKENNIKQVVITGVMTHLCCESTARDAFIRNYEVFFVIDATATYSEELHLGALRSITHGFGVCVTSEEILNAK